MKTVVALLVLALTFAVCLCQDDSDAGSGIESAYCIFSCISSFQRKGVAEGESLTTPAPSTSESVCERLELDALVGLCESYRKADVCLGTCVNNPTKKIIIGGLNYICVHRISDFEKHMPCYKDKCSTMEKECGGLCGGLATAEEQLLQQLGVRNDTTSDKAARRKRDTVDADTASDSSSSVTTTEASSDGSGVNVDADPIDTCQFVRCYVNCSRPMLERDCGKDAYILLKQTSNILLSFVMAPLEQSWAESSNTTLPEAMTTCDNFFSQALTDVGVDRDVLKSTAARPTYNRVWSILLSPLALAVLIRFH